MLLTLSLTLFELCRLPVIYSAITSRYLLLAREVFPDVIEDIKTHLSTITVSVLQ